ncbi:hypothetical protein HG530_007939 [Fusarium avenaceum]|nr:hypothetical protein HG530_007939 [Fusarium avenaceum]
MASAAQFKDCTLLRIVWVDALCISQNDLAERSQQVQLMGDIYKQAVETIIWFDDVFPPFDANFVVTVFGCPWFERRWVIQEVALASSAVAKVPEATMQWKWIGLAAGIIRTNHDWLINSYRMPNLYNAYLISRLSTHGALPPLNLSLLSVLRLTTGFKTAEKLDVFFALLGVLNRYGESSSSQSSSVTIRADYKLSESELGKLVAESHMARSRPLSFLSDAVGVAEKPT